MVFSLSLLALLVICFLLGSIPWGVIISRVFYKTDVRSHGSGNIGTTNAFRAMGKLGGSLVFLLDFGKGLICGMLPYILLHYILPYTDGISFATEQVMRTVAFVGAIEGHIFSPWLHFKGGKGIAVAIGAMVFTFGWIPALIEIAIFALVVAVSKKISLGSLAATIACPVIARYVFMGNWLCWILITIAAATIIWAHRSNIERLRKGNESTVSKKSSEQ